MATLPRWLEPMAATLTQERFAGAEWRFERKYDGIRLLAFKWGGDVTLYSRNQLRQNVPAVAAAIARLPVDDAILDGELEWDQRDYHVFDLLWVDGRDLTGLPLADRLAALHALPLKPPLRRVAAVDHPRPWELAAAEGWEGVIAKRAGSRYEHRRSKSWLKMKVEVTRELVIGGFTDPQGKRVGLGALLVGHREDGELVFAGKVGTGLDTAMLLELRRRLDALEVAQPPFTRGTGLPRRAHWVRPEITVQVGFIEWTRHGKLRHPRLLDVRL
jgi:bifunctional non-homologous end joining protein LigD